MSSVSRTEALIYAIGVDPPDRLADGALDVAALRRLTDPTGGATHPVATNDAIADAAERIGDELRQQYVLGFAPEHPGDRKFHKVQVTVGSCVKCRVHARSGYIADPPAIR